MDLFRGSRCGMHSFILIHLCWLGWLCGLAFGLVISEALTGSANFSDIQLTCVANLVAFITFILRGKHYVYKGVRGCKYYVYKRANHITEKLKNINELKVLTTNRGELHECSVVMLSFQMPMPNDSTKRFMRYLSNLYDVQSIFLQCLPLQSAEIAVDMCTDTCTQNHKGTCGCIVFNSVEDITIMLVRRMPGTLKKLSASLSLLPSLRCLKSGCHGYNRGLLHVENDRLRKGDPQVESPAAVCEIIDLKSIHKVGDCICIPLRSANDDEWTNQLIKLLKPEDELVMDGFDLNLCLQMRRLRRLIICAIIVLQILCIVVGSAIAGVLGIHFFGRWIYSALQCLVWLKWIIGVDILFILRLYSRKSELNWWYHSCGLYIGCSAVLLNAILAGIRAKWEFS